MPVKRTTSLRLLVAAAVAGFVCWVTLAAPLTDEGALGHAALDRGDYSASVAHFRRALTPSPDDADTLLSLGVALLADEKPGEALAPLAHLADVAPSERGYVTLGLAQERTGRLKEALDSFTRAEALAEPGSRRQKAATAAVERVSQKVR